MLVQWSTASEMNAAHFDIERSYDGNVWTVLDKVKAVGTSNITNNYSYTDRTAAAGAVYYRIREVDADGGFAFTSIQSIRGTKQEAIKIASTPNNIMLQFAGMSNTPVTIRIVSLAGQVIHEKLINQPAGQVMLPTSLQGNYIVSVSNGHDINVARQVAL